jgi:GxxExxY protein
VQDAGAMGSPRHLNDPETYAIIGAALAVYAELGCGFIQTVYKAALAVEFRRRAIAFDRDVPLPIVYRGEPLPLSHRVDFLCAKAVIVEVQALDALSARDVGRAVNYVRAARIDRGLLLNFGTASLELRRLVWRRSDPGPASSGPCAGAAGSGLERQEGEGADLCPESSADSVRRVAARTLTWTPWRASRTGRHGNGPSPRLL